MNSFKIYVACLSAYNNGKLHGVWIDLDSCSDTDDIHAQIDDMLKNSPEHDAEEWAIHDTELPEGVYKIVNGVGAVADFDDLIAINECEHPDLIAGLISQGVCDSVESAIKYHDENYQGQHESLDAYAYDYLESTGALSEVPESIRYYIDTEKLGRDMELGGDIFTISDGGYLHVYTNA
jgi:antirestriction protein